ncbi:molybdopterin-binding protein [Aneurinibacillus sp. Ricciae_BoGa-3]|uniref:molybdopterin-binding protein n=1 Tax=Aneurinibacillus sp. Ricciae_BoGa-3 TaxID=3022697 RepID=UPI002340332E|nr:molybdopterin-binding protein [Aneurinibacillus sp. Ricciae_BoGa-3]WCK52576.1 molybdopterin-binding protein [Aneurinibacillus sp. Ricciae_BoGa-3]
MEYSLLNKTELRLTDVYLDDCDLTLVAETVAEVLQLPRERVFVIDVRDDHLALDLLVSSMKADQFVGKKEQLLDTVGSLPGVRLGEDADIHSEGVLGMIALTPLTGKEVVEQSNKMGEEIVNRIRHRVKVFPTGFEVARGMIEDTNTPYLVERFTDAGCKVQTSRPLADDVDEIAGALRQALDAGFGWILTTGGVGAEDKDCSVEALLKVCPEAATPYIVKFTPGHGRHVKEGIRIGVAKEGLSYIVTLPGPNDEVRICADIIMQSVAEQPVPEVLAERIASKLRDRWLHTVGSHSHADHHGHQHHHGHGGHQH